ncbi:MAG: hypothetical protein Q9160_006009 [Pyrenula sp. 1 TL-2023]
MNADQYLFEIDLSNDWDSKAEVSLRMHSKATSSSVDDPIPVLMRGSFFAGAPNDNNIYLYGGTTSFVNTTFPDFQWPGSQQYVLWSYNTVQQKWTKYDRQTVSSDAPNRPNAGSWAGAPDQGYSFYFNGQIDQGSSKERKYPDSTSFAMDGMIAIDLNNQTARNLSTQGVTEGSGRTRGGMVYLPNVGRYGLMVQIGGMSTSLESNMDNNIFRLVRRPSEQWT